MTLSQAHHRQYEARSVQHPLPCNDQSCNRELYPEDGTQCIHCGSLLCVHCKCSCTEAVAERTSRLDA